ncbi:unnamed protein product [Closterium sp. NIES-54]
MASLRVLAFDNERCPLQFDTWLNDLQLYLLSDSRDSVSLFEHTSGIAPAPPATADSATRSQWLTRDAAARLDIRNHLPLAECAHFGQHRTAQALYDAIVARYSSPATAALGRLLLPYLFPELSAFATVEDLVSHLRTSDARYRAAAPAQFLVRNQPPMFITLYFIVTRLPDSLRSVRDHFLSLDPTILTIDLLEQHLLAAETSAVAVGAARGTPRTPFFEGCFPSPLAPSYASAAAIVVLARARVAGVVEGGSGSVSGGSSGGSGGSGGDGSGGSGGGSGGIGGGGGGSGGSGGSGSGGSGGGRTGAQRGGSGAGQRQRQQRQRETPSPQQLCEWLFQHGASGGSVSCPYVICTGDRAELLRSGVAIFDLDYDAILSAMYALSASAEGDCYWCVPPDPGIEAASLGASESSLSSTAPAKALHTFTLDSGASRCFFRDSTTLTPLPAHVPVRLADSSGGPVVARSSTVLPCPAVPSGSLSGLHLPSFSTNLVSTAALQDSMVTTTTPRGQRVSIFTCTRTGRHMATFTFLPGSKPHTLATKPPQVATSAQVFALGPVAPPCSCRLLSHQTLLWHHRLGHPSLPSLHGMHSRLLVSGLPWSLPPLPPSPDPPCLPCVEGRQRATPHSSFPPTSAPLQTLHMDVWGRARVSGQGRERYFLLVDDDYTCYTTVFPLRSKGEVQNGIAERRIGLAMIHAATPHLLWLFAVRYAAHQLNLCPHVSLPETSPTLRWTGKVGDASVFQNWGSRAFVRDTSADKNSACAIPYVFLGFPPDAPGWQFYHPTSRRVFSSQDVTFDESVPSYRLFPYRSAPPLPPPLFLTPGPPPVDPLPPQGPAPSGVSQVDPLPGIVLVESEGAGTGGAEPAGAEPAGAELWVWSLEGAALSGGPTGALPQPEPLSPQQLRVWLVRRARLRSGAAGAGATGDTGAGGAGVTAGAGGTEGTGARGTGAGGAGAGGARAGGTGAGGAGAGGTGAGTRAGGAGAVNPGAGGAGGTGAGGTVRPRPYFIPLLLQVLGFPSSTSLTPPLLCPPPDQLLPPLQPASPLPAPSPSTEHSGGLTERREPASHPVSPVCTARHDPRSRGTHAMALRPSSVPLRVSLPPSFESSLPAIPDPESDLARVASPTVSRLLATVLTQPSFESTAASALIAELLDFAAACRLDYATALVAESESASPPSVGGECALGILTSCQPSGTRHPNPALLRRGESGTTLAAMGFTPSTADPSLFLRADTSLPPFYILVYVDDLVFAIADTEALTLVKSELQKRHTCTFVGELHSYLGLQITRDRARRTITLTQSHMVHQVLQNFGFQFSLA